jgi:hypothetical protein
MNKPQSTIGAVEADGVERQHRDQLFSLDRLCARDLAERVDLPRHRLQPLACGVPVVTLAAVVQTSKPELAAHVLEDRRVRRARSGPSRAASLQSPKSAESKENIEISPRSSDNMERNPLTLLLGDREFSNESWGTMRDALHDWPDNRAAHASRLL